MPAKVFVSYSHKDRKLKDQLIAHLSLLREEGVIEIWQDREIKAGSEFDTEILEQLQSADVILLLISADFLASPYCRTIEMKRALQRHEEGSARVIPIILRKVDWESSPFAKLLVVPTDGKPVASWRDRDEAFMQVTRDIRAAATAKRALKPSHITTLLRRNPNFTGRKEMLARLDVMPGDVFVAYAHEDKTLKDELLKHLSVLRRQGVIRTWHDRDIAAGSDFDAVIRAQLDSAAVILLLISSDFLNSDYCWSKEMTRALERHDTRSARVIPVILRSCDWSDAPFAKLLVIPTDGNAVTSWGNRDEAFTDVAKHIRAAAMTIAERPALPPRVFNLPPRNPYFTGRKDLLARLDESLKSSRTEAVVHTLVGLGGVGKTNLAIEYAYQHADDYTIVWWIRSEQASTLAGDYAALAEPLNLPERSLADQNAIVQAVKKHLSSARDALLIFDNVEKPSDIESFLPSTEAVRVITTTRNQTRNSLIRLIEVDVMERDEAIELLLRRSGATDRVIAGKLAAELGDLPFALTQAAAYVEQTAISLTEYLGLFTTRRKELWKEESSHVMETISATWNLAIEKIAASKPAAVELLKVYAFLAPDDIPRQLLQDVDVRDIPPSLRELADPFRMNEAIAALRRYSLISAGVESISVHRLVQFVVRDLMGAEESDWAAATFHLVAVQLPRSAQAALQWQKWDVLLPHVRRIVEIAGDLQLGRGARGNVRG